MDSCHVRHVTRESLRIQSPEVRYKLHWACFNIIEAAFYTLWLKALPRLRLGRDADKLNLAAKQMEHIVCSLQPSVGQYSLSLCLSLQSSIVPRNKFFSVCQRFFFGGCGRLVFWNHQDKTYTDQIPVQPGDRAVQGDDTDWCEWEHNVQD